MRYRVVFPEKRGIAASTSPSSSPVLASDGSRSVAAGGEPVVRGRPVPDDRRRPVRSRGGGNRPGRRIHGRKVLRRPSATYRTDGGVPRPRGKGSPSHNVPEPGGETED